MNAKQKGKLPRLQREFLRIYLEPDLGDPRQWQHQPHNRVLRPEERQRNADWSYSGAILLGYPELNLFEKKFWPIFWKICERERRAGERLGAVEAVKA
jgi:hypothetical protein